MVRRRKLTDTIVFSLRIREELRRRLVQEAKKQKHSLNVEIIRRLEDSIKWQDESQGVSMIEEWVIKHAAAVPPVLVTLGSLIGPKGRIMSMAALQTPEGRAAALKALRELQEPDPKQSPTYDEPS
jgi:hypothetical protein